MRKVALFFETTASNDRHMLRGVAKYSRLHGPWLIDCKIHPFYISGRSIWRQKVIPELKKWQPDGIIAHVNSQKARDLIEFNVPIIMGVLTLPEYQNVPYFADDNTKIGASAAEYLAGLGFKNFAFCGFDNLFWSKERFNSFSENIVKLGYQVHVYNNISGRIRDYLQEERYSISNWLKTLPKPVALMACNDVRGQQVIDACKLANIAVPEEVSVLGVDNDDLICDTMTPPLSSVSLAIEEAGYKTAQLLDQLMSGKKVKQKTISILPTHIVRRQSTDILAIDDPELAKAIRFIRLNAKITTSVNEVVTQTNLARRALEQRFKKHINKTISHEIRRVCVERISQMLLETNMPVFQIAAAMGSSSSEHLARTFRTETKMSPKEYRRQYSK